MESGRFRGNPGTRSSNARKQGLPSIEHGPELVDSNSCWLVRPNNPTATAVCPGI